MKIDFENLGGIDKGGIELNDFTLFCGKNNSGKTYVMYVIYGLLVNNLSGISDDSYFIKSIWDKLKQNGTFQFEVDDITDEHLMEMIDCIEKLIKDNLPSLFGAKEDQFFNTVIHLNFDCKALLNRAKKEAFRYGDEKRNGFSVSKNKDSGTIKLILFDSNSADKIPDSLMSFNISRALYLLIFTNLYRKHFLLPAERAGINLFFKELFSIRNILLQEAQNDNVDPMHLLNDVLKSRYAEPVKDYMQFLNRIGSDQIEVSDYSKYAQVLEKNVLGGKYEVDEFGNVFFFPVDSKNKLPLHFSSSTVKTLFGLVFYLEHLAKPDDYLMIDEPELNLHPDNQRQVARVLAQLVNAGLKVVVSTHSDYFVRELNNLIMLKNDFSGAAELQKKYDYQDNELLSDKRVSAYLFDDKKITPMVMNEEGIVAETFNDVINKLNQSSNEIYYAMQDAKELESW